jgi:hypothetical protein
MVVTALTMTFAYLCGCSPVLEQPVTSCMPKAEPMQSVLGGIAASKHVIWHGAYSRTTPKPLQVWSSRNLSSLVQPRPVDLKSDLVNRCKKRTIDGQLRSTYTGTRNKLKASQTYCNAFGRAVATLARTFVHE